MSSTQIQVVKWTFPAFALLLGLLWYKRRRVNKSDPGGIITSDLNDKNLSLNEDIPPPKHSSSFHDSGIQINDTSLSNSSNQQVEDIVVCTPRKRSESLDIPARKNGSQSLSHSRISSKDEEWYSYADASSKTEIQLGSNPKISNFEMVARSRSSSSLENVIENSGKMLKIFDNLIEEDEQKLPCDNNLDFVQKEMNEANDTCNILTNKELSVSSPVQETVNNSIQAMSERDSANHSPVSGVLEGSVTDEARSEGSTDSGKGGSIKGHAKDTVHPILYEFDIPQTLVGRLIGRHGSFLQAIIVKAEVHIVVKRHPTSRDHKICAIEGTNEGINIALDMIRQKFPEKKYPQVTLEQVVTPKIPVEVPWVTELMQLSLIEGVNNDVVVCHIVKPNRLFVQLPTHPTYPSLRILDDNMTQLYDTTESPSAPNELSRGMILVAKWYSRWVRVYIEQPDPQGEQHLVRLVDHGGYWFFSNSELKKIRSDFLTLPFQAIEIFIANVQPRNGEWHQDAYNIVVQMCSGIVGQAQIEGYINTNTYVNLYINMQKHGVISLADELIARGYAEPTPLESIVPEGEITYPYGTN